MQRFRTAIEVKRLSSCWNVYHDATILLQEMSLSIYSSIAAITKRLTEAIRHGKVVTLYRLRLM